MPSASPQPHIPYLKSTEVVHTTFLGYHNLNAHAMCFPLIYKNKFSFINNHLFGCL